MYIRRFSAASVMLVLLVGSAPLHAAAIDAALYTTYILETNPTDLEWLVCGSTQQSSGCYGAGNLGPFGKVGAMIEGNPAQSVKKGTVTRYIYVVDIASGSGGNGVTLYVYKKVDTITPSLDSVTVTLFKTITLPLTGGSATVASLAANKDFLFIGTNQTGIVAQVTKKNLAVTQFGSVNPPVTAITANDSGYVTVTSGANGFFGFEVIGPDGKEQEDGGGAPFMLNTIQGAVPSTLP